MGNVVPMDSKLLSNYWYMPWSSWPTHISKLCSHKNQGVCVAAKVRMIPLPILYCHRGRG